MKDPVLVPTRGDDLPIGASFRSEPASDAWRPVLAAHARHAGAGGAYQEMLNLMPVPVCLCDASGRMTFANPSALELLGAGRGEVAGSVAWFRVAPGDPGSAIESPLRQTIEKGAAFRDHELGLLRWDGTVFDASITLQPLHDAEGAIVGAVTVMVDVTDRKKRERQAALMVRLGEALGPLVDEAEIVRVATTMIGEHLGVQRCGIVENEMSAGALKVIPGWVRDPVPSLAGRHEVRALGDAEWQRTLGSTRLAINDVTTHPHVRQHAEAYQARGIRAYAGVPFARDGRWVASLTVTSDAPRTWTPGDLSVLDEAVSRIWPLIERARAQATLRLVSASAPIVLVYCDNEGRIVFANQAFAARWGTAPSEVTGHLLSEIVGEAAFAIARPHIERVLQGQAVQFETDLPYRGIGQRYVRISCVPDIGADQRVRGFLSAVSDLTDRRAMEQSVRESEQRYRELIRALPAALYVCDAEGRLVLFNDAAAELWGRQPELGETRWGGAWQALDSSGREIQREAWPLAKAYRNGTAPPPEEVVVVRPDGSRRHVVAHPQLLRDADGNITGGMNVLVDVTERKKVEASLRERDERLLLATQTGKLGLWDWDVERDQITWSDSLYEIHGIEPQSFRPTVAGFANLVHPEDRAMVGQRIEAALRGEQPYELELRALRPDGSVAWLFTNARVVRNADGGVRMVGATFDITERKQAELARVESEQRFRTLAQHAPVGIFQADRTGAWTFVNEHWCMLAATTREDAVADGWLRALHPDDRDRVRTAWNTAIKEDTAFSQEHRLLRSDGTVIWVQAGAVEFRDHAGCLVGYLGTVIDISERKVTEFALRESEKRFRLVASRAPVGIFMTNPQGETVFVNASWCIMAGLPPEQSHGLGWVNAIHPDDRQRVLAEWEEAVREGVSAKAEYRFVRPDGTVTWVHGTAVQLRDANGRLTGYIGTVADFTERKQAELALRQSEERFRLLADNIAQFAWILDADGRVLWLNRRLLEYAGKSAEVAAADGLEALQHPDHRARVSEKFRRHLTSGEPWEDSFPLRAHDGTYRWFLSRSIPIRDENGRLTRWFGTNTDITDLRETQEMLRKAQEELLAHTSDLERKVEARTSSLREAIVQMEEFSYSVSHDLRAPLRAMNAYAEALVEDYGPKLDDTALDYLRRIQRSSQRMEKLTHDVLTYSRLARAEIVLSHVDVGAVVRDLIGQYAELQPAAAELIIDERLHCVRGHELSLGQCLGNLLINAAKFVAPGRHPRIQVFTTEEGGLVRIWVVDNGIGIRPEHQRNLFQMFVRLPTETPYHGTGIGLAIVRKAVEKMGGRYGVESDGVNGSRFWIELPRA